MGLMITMEIRWGSSLCSQLLFGDQALHESGPFLLTLCKSEGAERVTHSINGRAAERPAAREK